MTTPLRITLIGFSGTGKSTVAELVAQRLGWQAVDSDDLIEQAASKNVRAIFRTEGEGAFRARETAFSEGLRSGDHIVVAAGGGGGLDESTRRAIVEAGVVICLEASVETVGDRISEATATDPPMLASLAL